MTEIITMPEALYRTTSIRFNPTYVNSVSQGSSFNPFARSDGPSAVFWQVDLSFATSDKATFLLFRRFVMKLRGGKRLARIYDGSMVSDLQGSQPLGSGGVTSTVNINADAAAGAEEVTLNGLVASQATAFKAGDQIGIGENLHVIEDDAPSDSSGIATVSIQPPLRLGAAYGDPVNLVKPTGLFRLTSGADQLTFDLNQLGQAFSLSFIEEPDFVS